MQKGSPHAGRALFAWLRGCGGCVAEGLRRLRGCVAAWLRGCEVAGLRGCGRAEAAGHLRSAGGPEGGDAPAAEQQTEAERCPEGRRGRKVARWPDWSGRSGPERAGAGRSGEPEAGTSLGRGGSPPTPPARRPLRGVPCEAPPARHPQQGAPCKAPPASPPLRATPCGCVSFRQALRTTASECRNG